MSTTAYVYQIYKGVKKVETVPTDKSHRAIFFSNSWYTFETLHISYAYKPLMYQELSQSTKVPVGINRHSPSHLVDISEDFVLMLEQLKKTNSTLPQIKRILSMEEHYTKGDIVMFVRQIS